MQKMKIAVITMLNLIFASVAIAHPGHGYDGGSFSIWHYLMEPMHFAVGILLIACMVVGFYWMKQKKLKARYALSRKTKRD